MDDPSQPPYDRLVRRSQAIFAGEEKGPGIICLRMREIPWELDYAWIFSVYLLVVFRYIPAYVQRMMAVCCL